MTDGIFIRRGKIVLCNSVYPQLYPICYLWGGLITAFKHTRENCFYIGYFQQVQYCWEAGSFPTQNHHAHLCTSWAFPIFSFIFRKYFGKITAKTGCLWHVWEVPVFPISPTWATCPHSSHFPQHQENTFLGDFWTQWWNVVPLL